MEALHSINMEEQPIGGAKIYGSCYWNLQYAEQIYNGSSKISQPPLPL